MPNNVYRQLAQRLDQIPNGFPATKSGAELRLLAKLFEPAEAALAAIMRLTPEPAADIAARLGRDEKETYRMLTGMARKGLIAAARGHRTLLFGLMPFVVGFYEAQLPRMDAEMAQLFEAYFLETRGLEGDASMGPAVHRVIPVEESIPFSIEVLHHERASEIVEAAQAWGVRDCICRLQQRLIGQGCDHPIEVCLVLAPVAGAFDHSSMDRALTKEEALAILKQSADAGLVPSISNHRDGIHYVCNCCTCGCGVLRAVAEFGRRSAVASSGFRATVGPAACIGCGLCLERCQFDALSLSGDVCAVDVERCMGCGLCVTTCPTEALSLIAIDQPTDALPVNEEAWLSQRAQARGIDLERIM